MLTTKEFLQAVITCPTPGYFCMALSNGNGGWLEQWYKWPEDIDEICEKATAQASHANCYFSSYLFRSPQSLKENVLPTRTIQADLDDADMAAVPIQPTILVETSPGRHQGYWLLDPDALSQQGGFLPTEEHETLSRKLTYSIELCDRSGWPVGRKVRIPGTINHKYLSGPKDVRVTSVTARTYKPEELEVLPEVPKFLVEHFDDSFIEDPLKSASDTNALELLERIKNDVPATVWTRYATKQQDRSEALWSLMVCAFKAGLTREEVFTLAKGSANNKFEDLRTRGDQALAKDVLRAEHAANTNAHDARAVIRDIYRKPLASIERKRSIFSVVLQTMRDQGEFLNTRSGFPWYIRRDIGRPVMVTPHSKSLQTILDIQFGLNATEPEAKYVVYGLSSYVDSLPDNALQSSLSYYDQQAGHLLVHAGKGTVLQVTQYAVTQVTDGAHGVIFPWSSSVAAFSPTVKQGDLDWGDEIFGNGERGFGTSVENLLNMRPDVAKALLKVWMLFVLLRNAANTRPILATFGMPGCIASDTRIEFKRGTSRTYSCTVAQLHSRFNSAAWNKGFPLRMLSLKDGVIKWRNVSGVVYSGIKQTHRVTTDNGASICATADHRFLTVDGYKRLEELRIGDMLVSKGAPVVAKRVAKTRKQVNAAFHPHAWPCTMVQGGGRYTYTYMRIGRARAVLEADLNGLAEKEFLHIVNNDEGAASTLQYLPKDVHVHHNDLDPLNDALDNLRVMTDSQHISMHAYDGSREYVGPMSRFTTATSRIVSITPRRKEHTYDIQMEDEDAPSFLPSSVDGLVLHNSGKTLLMKKIYCTLYGPYKALSGVTSVDNFDMETVDDPLVVLDNVDTWERWLPDRLAQAASVTEFKRRKLWTDADTITLRRQAVLGVTAHNPKFGREDVADRLLLFSYQRLDDFTSEDLILNDLLDKRNRIWGALIHDAQRVLRTPMPAHDDVPQFRIQDFARLGLWIARAIGEEEHFRKAITNVKSAQQAFTLEEEGMLVTAVARLVKSNNYKPNPQTAAQLWTNLEMCVDDQRTFAHTYRNSVMLSKKLSAMIPALRSIVDITQGINEVNARTWTISPRNQEQEQKAG